MDHQLLLRLDLQLILNAVDDIAHTQRAVAYSLGYLRICHPLGKEPEYFLLPGGEASELLRFVLGGSSPGGDAASGDGGG